MKSQDSMLCVKSVDSRFRACGRGLRVGGSKFGGRILEVV